MSDDDWYDDVPEPLDVALPVRYAEAPDIARYRRLIELGAAFGDPMAIYANASWYLNGADELGIAPDLRRAVALLKQAAPVVNRAAFDLGICYLDGKGVRRDARRAYALFASAAAAGLQAGLKMQAYCLAEGIGVRRNPALLRRLERKLDANRRRYGLIDRATAVKRSRKRTK